MSKKHLITLAVLSLPIFILPLDASAQTDLGAQTLGRGFWHVFAAYAILWALVFGWIIRIGRQLARVEQKLDSVEG